MPSSRYDVWVGSFIVLALFCVVFLALKTANLLSYNSEKTYSVTALFDDIGGLRVGASVRSAGIVVGKVTELKLDAQSFHAIAKIQLQQKYKFPQDSRFKIMTAGILGEQYIAISAGYDELDLAENARITNTQSAVVLENLISQFMYQKTNEAISNSDKITNTNN